MLLTFLKSFNRGLSYLQGHPLEVKKSIRFMFSGILCFTHFLLICWSYLFPNIISIFPNNTADTPCPLYNRLHDKTGLSAEKDLNNRFLFMLHINIESRAKFWATFWSFTNFERGLIRINLVISSSIVKNFKLTLDQISEIVRFVMWYFRNDKNSVEEPVLKVEEFLQVFV